LLANSDPKIQKVLDNANLATISAKSAIDKYGKVAEQVDVKSLNNTIEKLSVTSDKLNSVNFWCSKWRRKSREIDQRRAVV